MATEHISIMVDIRVKAVLETAINANSILNIRSSTESPFSVELQRTSDGVVTHAGLHWKMSDQQQTEFDSILVALGLDGDRNSTRTGNRVSTWTDREKSFDEALPDIVRKRDTLERVPFVGP